MVSPCSGRFRFDWFHPFFTPFPCPRSGLPPPTYWGLSPPNFPRARPITYSNDLPCAATTFLPLVQSAVAQSRRKTDIPELAQLNSQDGLIPWLAGQ